MAVDTDPQILADNAKCYESCISDGMQLPVLIYIFSQIANVNTDTQSLVDNARCYDSCIPKGMQLPVLIYVATQIANNGVVGQGAGASFASDSQPSGAVIGFSAVSPTPPQMADLPPINLPQPRIGFFASLKMALLSLFA